MVRGRGGAGRWNRLDRAMVMIIFKILNIGGLIFACVVCSPWVARGSVSRPSHSGISEEGPTSPGALLGPMAGDGQAGEPCVSS